MQSSGIICPEKIKLRFFPADDQSINILSKEGNRHLLDLTLKSSKNWKSVVAHLENKWSGINNFRARLTVYFVNLHGVYSANLTESSSKLTVGETLSTHPALCMSASLDLLPVVQIYYAIAVEFATGLKQNNSPTKSRINSPAKKILSPNSRNKRSLPVTQQRGNEPLQQEMPPPMEIGTAGRPLFTNEDSLFNAINELGDFSMSPFLQPTVPINEKSECGVLVDKSKQFESPFQTAVMPPLPLPLPQKVPEGDLSLLAAGICFESDSLFLPLSGAAGGEMPSRLFFSRQGGKSTATQPISAIETNTKQQQTIVVNPPAVVTTAPMRIFDFIRNSSAGRMSPMMNPPLSVSGSISSSSSLSSQAQHLSASALPTQSDSLPPLHVTSSSSSAKNRIAPTLLMRSQSDGLASGVFQRFGNNSQQSLLRPIFHSSVSPATVASPISDVEDQLQKVLQEEEEKEDEETKRRQEAAIGEESRPDRSAPVTVVTESESENVKPAVALECNKSIMNTLKRKNSDASADATSTSSSKKCKTPSNRPPTFQFHNSQYHSQHQQVQDSEDSMDALAVADYPRRAALFRQTLAGRVAGVSHSQNDKAVDFARLLSREGRSRLDLRRISPTFIAPLSFRDQFLSAR
jgi:hypothetical protein